MQGNFWVKLDNKGKQIENRQNSNDEKSCCTTGILILDQKKANMLGDGKQDIMTLHIIMNRYNERKKI